MAKFAVQYAVIGWPAPAVGQKPDTLPALPVVGEGALPLLPGVLDEAGAAVDTRVGEDQVDVIAVMLFEQFVAELQDLRLVGYVTGMAGDLDTGRGGRPHGRRGRRCGVRIDVAHRDRTAPRRQLADKLAADA